MSLPAGGGFRFDSGCGHMDEHNQLIDIESATDAWAGEPGYYQWKQTTLANPRFVELFLEEQKAQRFAADHMRRKAAPASVYFVQQSPDGPIKIGATRSVVKRLKTLQTGSHVPLTVLGVVPGGFELESDLHRQLMDYQLEGEWFSPTPEVMAVVKRHINRA